MGSRSSFTPDRFECLIRVVVPPRVAGATPNQVIELTRVGRLTCTVVG